ncbi:hypothetical protein ACFP4H_06390 [Pseudophaeobacter arcticus]|uniref:hypothetical protein n=1 Tax=Pseudophaeobacter arcticus TaxID=385492 RepID=UPI000414BD6F|nr:hypothetical protein [Pseudophaeobacter arcticus]
MFVSYDLRAGRGFAACRGAQYIRLGAGLHAAVDPGQGLVSARRGRGLDLRFSKVSDQAAWLELGLKLGAPGQGRSDRAWRDSSRFYCRLRLALQLEPQVPAQTDAQEVLQASTQVSSQASSLADILAHAPEQEPPPQARLALRLHLRDGFEDIFAPDPLPLSPDFTWVRAEIAPPVWALSQAQAVDLHLFLPPRNGALQVSDLAVTAVT